MGNKIKTVVLQFMTFCDNQLGIAPLQLEFKTGDFAVSGQCCWPFLGESIVKLVAGFDLLDCRLRKHLFMPKTNLN